MATKIAGKAVGLSGDDIHTWLTPGTDGMKNKASYWWVDEEEIEKMLMEIYSVPEASKEDKGNESKDLE
jgi:hypothetical protein